MTSAARRPSGELESAVLETIWAAARPLTARDVRAALGDGLARTTVATILGRLHAKGLLRRVRAGRTYAYSAVVEDPAALTAHRMHTELDRSGDERPGVLARFVSDLNESDERLLRDLLERPRPPEAR
ncbi:MULTISPECIES: BlaI/MecI/CopY family transcriptional regulator [Actinomadura]|uniref:BlaI/MecI/CopY family transcriptional regulator n=1 Tax=Actinomadura montaniterrae TaxID=1803903 RepID=A0A6L3VN96_9ACTN|nr:BlaI/MecI/CopY family transcriptional regulator [Actinomadura montaniterrae]KAB2374817.1 BlaI/MecI/CopY family transcriptional regulator [Actinomadura montaniterrae]